MTKQNMKYTRARLLYVVCFTLTEMRHTYTSKEWLRMAGTNGGGRILRICHQRIAARASVLAKKEGNMRRNTAVARASMVHSTARKCERQVRG